MEHGKNNNSFVIIDGHSFAFRAYYARGGDFIERIFMSMINKIIKTQNPKYLLICFDSKEKTFRHNKYPDYKGKRKPIEDKQKFTTKFDEIITSIANKNIKTIAMEGYEADDLIASASILGTQKNVETIIVSGDKDMIQLVNDPFVKFLHIQNKDQENLYDENGIKNKFGLTPKQYLHYVSLKGDPSDNIKGITGFGEKTAKKAIVNYDSLDNLYAIIESEKETILNPINIKTLKNQKEKAYRNYDLMKLVDNLPIGKIEDFLFYNTTIQKDYINQQSLFA